MQTDRSPAPKIKLICGHEVTSRFAAKKHRCPSNGTRSTGITNSQLADELRQKGLIP